MRSVTSLYVKKIFFEAAYKAYNYIVQNYGPLLKSLKKDFIGNYPYVCWTESDFRTLIIYYMLHKLKGDVFIHSEFKIAKNKFKYDSKELNTMWNNAVQEVYKVKKRNGDIDIAVTSQDIDTIPFLLIAEIKYYHYKKERYRVSAIKEVENAYKILNILKQKGVAHEIAMVIGDHYYHIEDRTRADELRRFARSHKSDVLYLEIKP